MTVASASGERLVLRPLPNLKVEIDSVVSRFRAHFRSAGYYEEPAVPLSSGVDSSVIFVGSTANVFKRYLSGEAPLRHARFVVQRSLRTQYLRTITDPESKPAKTSLFTALGIVAPTQMIEQASRTCYEFMRGLFADHRRRLVLRASSDDADLVELIRGFGDTELELDGSPQTAYRHRYGIPGLVGRNFNFAAVGDDGELCDIGNFVVLEEDGRARYGEFGIGAGTTLQRLHGLMHPVQASPVGAALPLRDYADVKHADCIAAAHALLAEGLRPNATSPGKILRSYLRAISALRRPGPEGLDEIADAVRALCPTGSVTEAELPGRVRAYVKRYEELMAANTPPERAAAELAQLL